MRLGWDTRSMRQSTADDLGSELPLLSCNYLNMYLVKISLSWFTTDANMCFPGHKVHLVHTPLLTLVSQWPLHLWLSVQRQFTSVSPLKMNFTKKKSLNISDMRCGLHCWQFLFARNKPIGSLFLQPVAFREEGLREEGRVGGWWVHLGNPDPYTEPAFPSTTRSRQQPWWGQQVHRDLLPYQL